VRLERNNHFSAWGVGDEESEDGDAVRLKEERQRGKVLQKKGGRGTTTRGG